MPFDRPLGRLVLALALSTALGAAPAGCGGKKGAAPPAAPQVNPLEDALRVLPPSAVVVGHLDARAAYASGAVGAQVAQLTEQLFPLGQEANFVPSRDVDEVTFGLYSAQGADAAAVLKGRFDGPRLEQMAASGTPTRMGVPVVRSLYGNRVLYTVSNVGFVVLTPSTVLAGTETGMRRALDRLREGRTERDFAPWILQALETPGAGFAVVADLVNPPGAPAALAMVSLPWTRGLQAVRVLGNFQPPGLNVAGTLTFTDNPSAEGGANGIRGLGTLANVLSMTGVVPKIQNLSATVAQTDVAVQFAVDDQSLRNFLQTLPRILGRGT